MREFHDPRPRLPYLCLTASNCLSQMHGRIGSELDAHLENSGRWEAGCEPNVQISLEEAHLMVGNLAKISQLLKELGGGSKMNGNRSYAAKFTPNGKIIWPLASTIRWVDGKSTGIRGRDFKVAPMLLTKDGQIRELNAMEKILYADQVAGVCQ